MSKTAYKCCPRCGKALTLRTHAGRERQCCPDESCGYVHWDNPIPVVAAIVDRGDTVILVRSIGWPEGWFGLVTGFLEKGESPEDAVLREVKEEVGLEAEVGSFIGMYPFFRMNQLILAYHVRVGKGEIVLDETELEDHREVEIEKLRPWPAGTGIALRDWLRSRGIEREFMPFPSKPKE